MEIGVGDIWASMLWPWILSGNYDKATFIEPHPRFALEVQNTFSGNPKIELINKAISSVSGERVEFLDFGQGSHVRGVNAPHLHDTEKKYSPHTLFMAPTITLDEVDDGNYDFVNIDVEGMEATVLEHMVSRPLCLVVETHFYQTYYVTTNIEQIFERVLGWGYKIQAILGSETVFVRKD